MWGGGGGYAARLFILLSFPCSADHERDWPPCIVVFFGLATNTLNVRNNKQQQLVVQKQKYSDNYIAAMQTEKYSEYKSP